MMRRRLLVAVLALVAFVVLCAVIPATPLRNAMPIPTQVYSRPLALVEGGVATRDEFRAHLRASGYVGRSKGALGPGDYRLTATRYRVGLRAFAWPDGVVPARTLDVRLGRDGVVEEIRVDDARQTSVLLEPVRLGVRLGADGEHREWVPLDEIPQPVVDAVLAAEDARFFWHPGVDPIRIAGAALANLRAQRIAQGASTITQQLAKNLYLGPERTWARKGAELAISLWLELRHSKREILEAYLNQVYLAQQGGRAIHGVAAAARHFYDAPLAEVDLPQAALLAAVIRSPNRLSPHRHRERARAARNRVLAALAANGRLDEEALARTQAAPLGVVRPGRLRTLAPQFLDRVDERLAAGLGAPGEIGARVFTTLDPALQRAAEASLREGLRALENERRLRRSGDGALQAALVVLDPRSGEVLAQVGARDPRRSPFDRATRARRQPGSVFKPIVALAALDADGGRRFTLATVLEDAPLAVPVEEGTWSPRNIDGTHVGPVTLRDALEQSRNVPFARLGMEVGLVDVAEQARAGPTAGAAAAGASAPAVAPPGRGADPADAAAREGGRHGASGGLSDAWRAACGVAEAAGGRAGEGATGSRAASEVPDGGIGEDGALRGPAGELACCMGGHRTFCSPSGTAPNRPVAGLHRGTGLRAPFRRRGIRARGSPWGMGQGARFTPGRALSPRSRPVARRVKRHGNHRFCDRVQATKRRHGLAAGVDPGMRGERSSAT